MAQKRKQGKRRRVPAFRKKEKNILAISIGIITLAAVCAVMFFGYQDLTGKRNELQQQAEQLQIKIDAENERTAELQEFETYTHTKKYAEETAKDVLGYVYDDEIVFKLGE